MKHQTIIRTTLLASVCCLLLYACTGGQEDLERLNAASQNADSRAADPVTATVTLSETDRLEAQLTAALGDAKLTVQNLTISGTFYAEDVTFLHTLTALEKLDMTNAEIKGNNNQNQYSFTYSYEDSNGNIQEGNATEYVSENTISVQMLSGMTSLKEFKIPATVTAIAWWAFRGCTSLSSITIPANVETISSSAFIDSGITALTVAEGVTSISGFNECKLLKTITLPSSLKEIGNDAFQNCLSLESFTIPEGVEKIGPWALANNPQLTSIVLPASVTTLGYGVFYNCSQLKSLTIPATVTQVDGSLVDYCNNLQTLIWNTTVDVPGYSPNSNCFLCINSSGGVAATYDANNWPNTIVDGEAESIRLTYSNSSGNTNQAFSCPIAFKAKNISLAMDFYEPWNARWTYEGKASGWRTIVLPFNVSSITSEQKGALAPFGSNAEGTKPFWLRKLTADGFVDETSIEANKPYIIAMPYNPDVYLDEYNICGNVTFTGENVNVEVTPATLPADEGPEYDLQPTFRYVKRSGLVYALNYNYSIRNHEFGSVFARSSDNIYPYEAYVKPKAGGDTRALYEIDTRSANTRSADQKNTTGIPAIGDM